MLTKKKIRKYYKRSLRRCFKIYKKYNQEGFTLMELLVAISILAVLSGIVIGAVSPSRLFIAAVDSQRAVSSREIKNAISQYITEQNAQDLLASIPIGAENALPICREQVDATISNCINLTSLAPTYLQALPEDPGEKNSAITGYSVFKNNGNLISVQPNNVGKQSHGIDIVTNGLTAWWRSDELTGTTVKDIIHGYNGTLYANTVASAWSTTVAPTAFSNSGSVSYARANNPRLTVPQAPFRLQRFTYSLWTNSFNSDCNIAVDMTNHASVRIGHFGGTYANRITFVGETVTLSAPVQLNTWNHIAFSYDGAVVKFFINGELVASRNKVGTINYSGASQPYLAIGNTTAPGYCSFDGNLDDVRFYNRGLENDEIKRIASGNG